MDTQRKIVTDIVTGDLIAIYPECETHLDIMNDIKCNGYQLVQLIILPADGIRCEYQVRNLYAK